ncbi:protein FAR-RED IMPAIRED RESPONSE 1-like [Lotus japonicus]|uniref:protein FAR-RED IMPAIRED RESPONSE 1-like n=1 Tax=Lotus japonicus TaxID=34305 RepID=UPI00258DD881|nr:protein FAR-RED IMPAIRED RESPONSE 1-like [Lotus japonicus]XP_057430024.1 protein FAR-RED IMPAIRED RESPONSE 1-like [Lotus japonicus]
MNPYSDQPHVSQSIEVDAEVHCTVEDTVSSPKATLGSQSEEQEIKQGMSFVSVDALKTFYRDYGIRKGFGSMVRNSRKGKDGKLNYIILACSREGNYVSSNLVGKERRALGKEGDGKALLSYFTQMQQKNSDFFYEIDLDDNLCVRNVFWADARSREMCKYFGDVVSFDTTYLTNKYDMPFAPFVSVNHHGQSVLLGCGLISSEDTNTFAWLFETWKRCMFGIPPQGIITDQCKAMKKAIELVFPDARHRWCLWHIMKKIPEKFNGYGQYKEIKKDMKEAVYDSLDVTEFDGQWNTFIDKYGLRNNDWLTGLYLERTRWVPCFLKNYFWAGMSTTQRSESMNAFFDGYINSKTSLQQFVLQYSNALRDKAEKEYEADFQSSTTTIHCAITSVIERQFQQQYTNQKFKEVQAEFRGKMNCLLKFLFQDGSICHYEVTEEMSIVGRIREVNFKVIFNWDGYDISCTCLLFPFKGIMCRHSFLVLANERVKQIPSKYVLDRWSKNLRRTHTNIKCSYNLKHMQPQVERYDKLCDAFHKVAELASVSHEATELLTVTVQDVGEKVKATIATSQNQQAETQTEHPQGEQSADQNQATTDGQGLIRSPVRKPRRGRPPFEKVVKTKKAARNRRQNEVNNQDSFPVVSIPERGESSTVRSSAHITNCGAHIATDLMMTNVDANGNDVIYSQNCWPSQLSNVSTTGFVSLLAPIQTDLSASYNA